MDQHVFTQFYIVKTLLIIKRVVQPYLCPVWSSHHYMMLFQLILFSQTDQYG